MSDNIINTIIIASITSIVMLYLVYPFNMEFGNYIWNEIVARSIKDKDHFDLEDLKPDSMIVNISSRRYLDGSDKYIYKISIQRIPQSK